MPLDRVIELGLRLLLGLIPVFLFLGALVYLDSYKLVSFRAIARLIAVGAVAAVLSYVANKFLIGSGIGSESLTRFAAPAVEELLKGLPILYLLRARKIGFLVDAAIFGFAVGTGFAFIENIYYLWAMPDSSLTLWVVRGFGTAVMHGGTTALLAITAKTFSDRKKTSAAWVILPGLLIASAIHSLFNHFVVSPLIFAIAVLLVFPPLLLMVFDRSERALRVWLGDGFDLDSDLIKAIHSGDFSSSAAGNYLQSLRDHFSGTVLADMLCYLTLHGELSLRAKGMLMLRENGFPVRKDEDTDEKLTELKYLRRAIGKTGELALAPIVHTSPHDLWQLHMLD